VNPKEASKSEPLGLDHRVHLIRTKPFLSELIQTRWVIDNRVRNEAAWRSVRQLAATRQYRNYQDAPTAIGLA